MYQFRTFCLLTEIYNSLGFWQLTADSYKWRENTASAKELYALLVSFWLSFFLPLFQNRSFKVAEHSFSARFCWCKLARAQGFQKPNMPSTERSFYLLYTRTVCVIFLYNCMQCIDGSSILLQRYVTKGNDAKSPAFLAFACYRKNPVKCNACAVARKIETDCFSRNVPFSSDPVVRISRNLAKK